MGPIGWQETVFIFILALLLFGPKKLPELGRTIGKAMNQFRQASNELKAEWNRQMSEIERETQTVSVEPHIAAPQIENSYYDTSYHDDGHYGVEPHSGSLEHANSLTVSAAAPLGAELPVNAEPTIHPVAPAEHVVPASHSSVDQPASGSHA